MERVCSWLTNSSLAKGTFGFCSAVATPMTDRNGPSYAKGDFDSYRNLTPYPNCFKPLGTLGENDMASKELTPLLTVQEAAELLHVSLLTSSKIEPEGHLVPFRTPGGHRRYSMEMLRRYLESTRNPPQTVRRPWREQRASRTIHRNEFKERRERR